MKAQSKNETSSTVPGEEDFSGKDRVKQLISELSSHFIGREEEARIAVLSLVTRNHCVFIGEPGTAKSALLRKLSEAVGGKYYYYLLSRYTIPDELIGPIDPVEYKNGNFKRLLANRLPQANIAFIDEVFKASSETLNTLLNIMNERSFVDVDGTVYPVPLISMFAASNELPRGDELQAFYDRILIKHFVRPIDPTKLKDGILLNLQNGGNGKLTSTITMDELTLIYNEIWNYMTTHNEAVADVISQLIVVMRQHGIFVSDRTAMNPAYFPMIVSAYSYIYDTDLKKSAITMSKYILQDDDEQLAAYSKALDSLYPPELRAAQEQLEKAKEAAAGGDLKTAKEQGLQAIQQLQGVADKPEAMELYKSEISELMGDAENLVMQINRMQEQLKSMKVRA